MIKGLMAQVNVPAELLSRDWIPGGRESSGRPDEPKAQLLLVGLHGIAESLHLLENKIPQRSYQPNVFFRTFW